MIEIHQPDVVLTDLALAFLGGYCATRLRTGAAAVLLAGLASAALWGAIFHGFFPAGTATPPGYAMWLLVALSIVAVAAALLWLSLSLLGLSPAARRAIVGAYAAACAALVLFVDESFGMIVRFYAPVLLLAIGVTARRVVRSGGAAWRWVAGGLALSAVAALAQQLGIGLHPTYFGHNAVYHVIQGVALLLLYRGFLRTRADGG